MSPRERLLHEVIIRALQMILNAWKRYLEESIAETHNDERPAK